MRLPRKPASLLRTRMALKQKPRKRTEKDRASDYEYQRKRWEYMREWRKKNPDDEKRRQQAESK